MDDSRRTRLRELVTRLGDRRDMIRGLAAFPILGAAGFSLATAWAPAAAQDSKDGKRTRNERSRKREAAKKGKKRFFCLNGETVVTRTPKAAKRMRERGAVPGKCACAPESWRATCRDGCLETQNNCGETVDCGFVYVAPDVSFAAQLGTGTAGSTAGQFNNPYAVIASADGRSTFVGDYSNNRISVWSLSQATNEWEPAYTIATNRPSGLAFGDAELTLYVSEYNNRRISIFTRPDAASTSWAAAGTMSLTAGEPGNPNAVTLSADELTAFMPIYTAANSRVVVWTRSGAAQADWAVSANIGSFGSDGNLNQLNQAADVAVTADGRTIYIADRSNHRIVIWSRPDAGGQDWEAIGSFGTYGQNADSDQFFRPVSVTLSPDERTIWVGDSGNNRISAWSRPDTDEQDWSYLSLFGGAGANPRNLSSPATTFVSPDLQTIWVGDAGRQRIAIFTQTCPA